jgi:hypothetical protein
VIIQKLTLDELSCQHFHPCRSFATIAQILRRDQGKRSQLLVDISRIISPFRPHCAVICTGALQIASFLGQKRSPLLVLLQ